MALKNNILTKYCKAKKTCTQRFLEVVWFLNLFPFFPIWQLKPKTTNFPLNTLQTTFQKLFKYIYIYVYIFVCVFITTFLVNMLSWGYKWAIQQLFYGYSRTEKISIFHIVKIIPRSSSSHSPRDVGARLPFGTNIAPEDSALQNPGFFRSRVHWRVLAFSVPPLTSIHRK